MIKKLKIALVFLKIVKSKGKTKDGTPIPKGVNKWNPFAYLIVLLVSIVNGILLFVKGFFEIWSSAFSTK